MGHTSIKKLQILLKTHRNPNIHIKKDMHINIKECFNKLYETNCLPCDVTYQGHVTDPITMGQKTVSLSNVEATMDSRFTGRSYGVQCLVLFYIAVFGKKYYECIVLSILWKLLFRFY